MRIIYKILLTIKFLLFYLYRLVRSNLNLAKTILKPKLNMRPGIIELPIQLKSDHEILSLINLITMTPGTICMDISDDKSKIYIHAMFVNDEVEFKAEIKEMEQRISKLFNK